MNVPRREIDKFCQSADRCVKERQRSGLSSAAKALHERRQAYEDLQRGRNQRGGETDPGEASPAPTGQHQRSPFTHTIGSERSASARRSHHPSAGRMYSLDSALAAASSHSLHGSTTAELNSTVADAHSTRGDAAGIDDMVSNHVQERSSAGTRNMDARPLMPSVERPEGALMAARRLVGHAVFGLEVCPTSRCQLWARPMRLCCVVRVLCCVLLSRRAFYVSPCRATLADKAGSTLQLSPLLSRQQVAVPCA